MTRPAAPLRTEELERYARHIVVGSRGLSGLDAHLLGSVSKQLLNSAECNLSIVH